MTVEGIKEQKQEIPNEKQAKVQENQSKEEIRPAGTPQEGNKSAMAIIGNVQPDKSIKKTAKDQLSKGFLDIKV